MMGYQFTECTNSESLRGVVSGEEDVESRVSCSVVNPVVFFALSIRARDPRVHSHHAPRR